MNFVELMTGGPAAGASVPASGTGRQQPRDNTRRVSEFGRVLENTMFRTRGRPGNSPGTQNVRSTKTDPVRQEAPSDIAKDKRPQGSYRSAIEKYREPDSLSRRRAAAPDLEESPGTTGKERAGPSEMSELLAQLTGLDESVLKAFLSAHGIPDELPGTMRGLAEAAALLSELLGLDAEQQEALTQLVLLMRGSAGLQQEETDASLKEAQPGGGTQAEALQGATEAPEKSQARPAPMPEFTDRLRKALLEKMEEYAGKLETEHDAAAEETANAAPDLTAKVRFVKSSTSGTNADNVSEAATENDEGMPDVTEMYRGAGDTETTGTGEGTGPDTGQKPVMRQEGESVTSDDMPNQEMIASIQDMRRPDAASSVQPGSAATNTAAAREIIRQITERAAVVLTREKAEMVMELKPESLGRLSLRVVTENGIVMAKFVAENTQVQRLLESNMQLLRDSLEKQGIIVQDLSVSVRQDSRQPYENGQQHRGLTGVRHKGASPPAAAVIPDAAGLAEASVIVDPWLWQGSTINLTA